MSIQSYQSIPFEYESKQIQAMSLEELNQQMGRLENSARRRQYSVRVLSCCLCPITCPASLVLFCTMYVVDECFKCCSRCCNTPNCCLDPNCLSAEVCGEILVCCGVPGKSRLSLILSPLRPLAGFTDKEDDFLLPPERQAMEEFRKELPVKTLSIVNEVFKNFLPDAILGIVYDYALPVGVVTRSALLIREENKSESNAKSLAVSPAPERYEKLSWTDRH